MFSALRRRISGEGTGLEAPSFHEVGVKIEAGRVWYKNAKRQAQFDRTVGRVFLLQAHASVDASQKAELPNDTAKQDKYKAGAGTERDWDDPEVRELGAAWYKKLRPELVSKHPGDFVVINVDTGAYVVAESTRIAMTQYDEQYPNSTGMIVQIASGAQA